MLRQLTIKDIEFLKNLQREMLTQETDHEAAPRYWVVAQHEKHYGCVAECSDGESMYDSSAADLIGDTVEEVIEHIKDYYDHECEADEDEYEDLSTMESLADYLNKHVDSDFMVSYYSIERSVRKNGSIFLTKRECKEHIEMNNYHYNDTVHTYADTSWRSPQVEKLYEILENVDFSALEVKQMSYKTGQVVKVKQTLLSGLKYGSDSFVEEMIQFDEVTIRTVNNFGPITTYTVEENGFYYNDLMLAGVADPEELSDKQLVIRLKIKWMHRFLSEVEKLIGIYGSCQAIRRDLGAYKRHVELLNNALEGGKRNE